MTTRIESNFGGMRSRACRKSIHSWVRCAQTYLRLPIYPKTHYVMTPDMKQSAMKSIEEELRWWHAELIHQNKLIEAQRLWQRTMFDLEMIKQIGFCHGIENYSRHFSGRLPGEAPPTLLDYLPNDAILFIDESHQTVPQLRSHVSRRPVA